MDDLFWLLPDAPAGRAGPNRNPWDPRALAAAGSDAVLSVDDGEGCRAAEIAALGMSYRRIPFSQNAPPLPGDPALCLDALPRAYGVVTAHVARGRRVLVHCSSGKDRTGPRRG